MEEIGPDEEDFGAPQPVPGTGANASPHALPSTAETGAKYGSQGYRRLADQIRDCEARWSNDCYRVAAEEVSAAKVSLVGISGPLRNAQMLYGDMCAVGYGTARDADQAARWWAKAAEAGSFPAAERLRNGLHDSMMHADDSVERM